MSVGSFITSEGPCYLKLLLTITKPYCERPV